MPGGSAPSCSHACSCASEAPGCSGAAPGRMLSVIWQRPPAAARKNSRCYGFLLLSGAQLLFESHGAPCFSECLYVCLPFVMLKTTLGSQGERNCFLHLRTKQGLARIWDLLTKQVYQWTQKNNFCIWTQLYFCGWLRCSVFLESCPSPRACYVSNIVLYNFPIYCSEYLNKASTAFIPILQTRKLQHVQWRDLPKVT